jgi:hypothetical protein
LPKASKKNAGRPILQTVGIAEKYFAPIGIFCRDNCTLFPPKSLALSTGLVYLEKSSYCYVAPHLPARRAVRRAGAKRKIDFRLAFAAFRDAASSRRRRSLF